MGQQLDVLIQTQEVLTVCVYVVTPTHNVFSCFLSCIQVREKNADIEHHSSGSSARYRDKGCDQEHLHRQPGQDYHGRAEDEAGEVKQQAASNQSMMMNIEMRRFFLLIQEHEFEGTTRKNRRKILNVRCATV